MRTAALLILTSAVMPILATSVVPRQAGSEKTTLNDIDTLCTANFSGEPKAIICMKDGTSTTFTTKTTTYLRNGDDVMCCEADNTCMLSSHSVPRAACYDPKTKRATIAQDGGPCELDAAGDGCKWTGSNRGSSVVFSAKGVTKVESIQDGKAVLGGGGGASGGVNKSGSGANGLVTSGPWALGAVGVVAMLVV